MHKKLLFGGALLAAVSMAAPSAFAVGGGVPFIFREGNVVGANNHPVPADSLDFTYHSCVHFTDANSVVESGYFWISSFQDLDSVVDSQINYYLANGYHLYGRYRIVADECNTQGTCNNMPRKSYAANDAQVSIYLDPAQDTVLGLANCQVTVANTGDDGLVGTSAGFISGQKIETPDQANGDFDMLVGNWMFTALGQSLFWDGMGAPLAAPILDFNANVTLLDGPLNDDHNAEGSGNLYWVD